MKLTRALSALAVAGLAAFTIATMGTAHADSANSATVSKDFRCFINIGGISAITNTKTHVVRNKNGLTISCHFDIAESQRPDKAVRFTGWNCFVGGVITNNSSFVATPGGRGNLVCHINGSN